MLDGKIQNFFLELAARVTEAGLWNYTSTTRFPQREPQDLRLEKLLSAVHNIRYEVRFTS